MMIKWFKNLFKKKVLYSDIYIYSATNIQVNGAEYSIHMPSNYVAVLKNWHDLSKVSIRLIHKDDVPIK